MTPEETLEKLLAVHQYLGILKPNGIDVQIPWQIGIDSVDLKTFYEGGSRYFERRMQKGILYVPMIIPDSFFPAVQIGLQERLAELETKWNIRHILKRGTVEEVQAELTLNGQGK